MSFFQKSLVDLVKGIRNAGNDGSANYISKAIQDIKVRPLRARSQVRGAADNPEPPSRHARRMS